MSIIKKIFEIKHKVKEYNNKYTEMIAEFGRKKEEFWQNNEKTIKLIESRYTESLDDLKSKYARRSTIFKEIIKKEQEINIKYEEYKNKKMNEQFEQDKAKYEKYINLLSKSIKKLPEEKAKGFPFLTSAFEEYFEMQDRELAGILETKSHPAIKAAEQIRQISKERRIAEKAARESKYLLDYCKYLAPWLEDYIGIEANELDELIKDIHTSWTKKEEEFEEEVKRHYGPKYQDLSDTEKLQRKLDWYWNKPHKYDWQIGRDYERYVGYLYEKAGCTVYYEGRKGFEDFGRDLIAVKENNFEVIQCKYWAQYKTIHEKHVFYLFGTTVEYFISNFSNKNNLPQLDLLPKLIKSEKIKGTIFTTTSVSEKAKEVAKTLGIQIVEKFPMPKSYPSIKCNISRKNGEKIYHLPFDQQYDTTLVEEERNECYVWTIEEAEKLGFRHAWKWHGEQTIK